jgi:phosphonate transport system ATP-binding protein
LSGCTFELRDATLSHPGTVALAGARLRIGAGERVALVGPSGAGKTSLLRLLGAAARATSGSVLVDDRDLASLDPAELRGVRARLGFVHQDHALVPNLRAISNALLGRVGSQGLFASLKSVWWPSRAEEEAVHALFVRVGIGDRLYQRVDSLSGGERQRVAIARALHQSPGALLCDEPVASVDPARARDTLSLLRSLSQERGLTLVASLHDLALAKEHFDRLVGLRRGRIVFDVAVGAVQEADLAALYDLDVDERSDLASVGA